jgi:hypothetical protein
MQLKNTEPARLSSGFLGDCAASEVKPCLINGLSDGAALDF